MVARAAPVIPISKPKINSGSRITLSRAPARVEIMANCGEPSARIMGLTAWENM